MNGFTLKAIRPLIHSSQVDGRSLLAVFRCPVTWKKVPAHWKAAPVGVSAAVAAARDTALFKMRSQVNGLVRSLLGFGVLGRTARQVSDLALSDGVTQLTAIEEEHALVGAFRSISSQFAWSEDRWVHASHIGLGTDLLLAVASEPELSSFDQDIAARMLVAVARAHGGITDEERLQLLDAFEGRLGSIESLLARPPLTTAELQQTNQIIRPALLGVAWSMAFTETNYDEAEERVIDDLADRLGVSTEDRVEARRRAQLHVLDAYLEQVFTWGEHDRAARDGLFMLAGKIGVNRGAAERAEARFLKRR